MSTLNFTSSSSTPTKMRRPFPRYTMAENAPPPTSSGPAAPADSSRGMPYYEKLRKDLRDSLQKKRILDNNLVRRPSLHHPSL